MIKVILKKAKHRIIHLKEFVTADQVRQLLKLVQREYQRRLIRYKSLNLDYSSVLIKDATFEDLSPDAIAELRKLLTQSERYTQDIKNLSDEQLLKNLLLVRDNKLTLAALILLGKEEGVSKTLPYAEIRFGYKVSEDEIRNQDTVIFQGGYLTYYKRFGKKLMLEI